jgi:hypothetical protein
VITDDHIANIDADPQHYPAIGFDPRIPIGQSALYLEPATHRVYRAVKLDQQPVAEGSDKATMVLGDSGPDEIY